MKYKKLIIIVLLAIILNISPVFALIKLDNESTDLAIKYAIKTKGTPTRDILGQNWMNDGTGRILNIYSPFIQIVIKAGSQNMTGNADKDFQNIKKIISPNISKIKLRNEIRFIASLYGDTDSFAQKYSAYIIDTDKNIIKPKKSVVQKIADKDSFNQSHPFSAVNCYTFKFDNISNVKKDYSFVLKSQDNNEIKYTINNQEIF